ncbi:MAG: 30S ribosomal protein S9 [Patescibacteria group bacterium]
MEKTTKGKYIEAVGRRKESIARVRITPAAKTEITVNNKPFETYFQTTELRTKALSPLGKSSERGWNITVLVNGGGINSQAEAFRHGLTRTLVKHDKDLRTPLKKLGFLKRDPRKKERKKFGLKKARKAPTWSKR